MRILLRNDWAIKNGGRQFSLISIFIARDIYTLEDGSMFN